MAFSDLPTPLSPVISTPSPWISISTPWTVVRGASQMFRLTISWAMKSLVDCSVVNRQTLFRRASSSISGGTGIP